MITLDSVLKQRNLIYRLSHEWGFIANPPEEVPNLYIDPTHPSAQSRLCLALKDDPKVAQSQKVGSRLFSLRRELSLLLQCNVYATLEKNPEFKENKSIKLSEEDKNILNFFGEQGKFRRLSEEEKEELAFDCDELNDMQLEKFEIAKLKHGDAYKYKDFDFPGFMKAVYSLKPAQSEQIERTEDSETIGELKAFIAGNKEIYSKVKENPRLLLALAQNISKENEQERLQTTTTTILSKG